MVQRFPVIALSLTLIGLATVISCSSIPGTDAKPGTEGKAAVNQARVDYAAILNGKVELSSSNHHFTQEFPGGVRLVEVLYRNPVLRASDAPPPIDGEEFTLSSGQQAYRYRWNGTSLGKIQSLTANGRILGKDRWWYVFSAQKLNVFDESGKKIFSIPSGIAQEQSMFIELVGNHIAAWDSNVMHLFDLGIPEKPKALGRFPIPANLYYGLQSDGKAIWGTGWGDTLYIVRIDIVSKSAGTPMAIDSVSPRGDLLIDGDQFFFLSGDSMMQADSRLGVSSAKAVTTKVRRLFKNKDHLIVFKQDESKLEIRDSSNMKILSSYPIPSPFHQFFVSAVSVRDGDAGRFCAIDFSGAIRVLSTNDKKITQQELIPQRETVLGVWPDGLLAERGGLVWIGRGGKQSSFFGPEDTPPDSTRMFQVAACARYNDLLYIETRGYLHVLDVSQGQLIKRASLNLRRPKDPDPFYDTVRSMSLFRGHYLATVGRRIQIWDLMDPLKPKLVGSDTPIYHDCKGTVINDRYLLIGNLKGDLEFWEIGPKFELKKLETQKRNTYRYVTSNSNDLALWDAVYPESGQLLSVINGKLNFSAPILDSNQSIYSIHQSSKLIAVVDKARSSNAPQLNFLVMANDGKWQKKAGIEIPKLSNISFYGNELIVSPDELGMPDFIFDISALLDTAQS